MSIERIELPAKQFKGFRKSHKKRFSALDSTIRYTGNKSVAKRNKLGHILLLEERQEYLTKACTELE